MTDNRRVRARIEGTVQGVGFRPYVYRIAGELGLTGWVRNDARGVVLEAEGPGPDVERFLARLSVELPPLAAIERLDIEERTPEGDGTFRIRASEATALPSARVSPDSATCEDCLGELFDPADRRYRYPFINCTNCGPRFTIVRGIPYDRPRTTMASFVMCGPCRAEYEDPADRRFHAQPNACPVCGPRTWLVDAERDAVPTTEGDTAQTAAAAIREGAIVAVKGLGGFHLACLAVDEGSVAALRRRKHREDKPFALMVPDLDGASRLVHLGPEERELLASRERPIVLAPRREDAEVAAAVAPGHRELGIMLPYSPLHHLLLADTGRPLVMTSGNVSDEPIAYRNDEALERLAGIADLFLLHDRPIETRTDDSVIRVVSVAGRRRPMMLRRSRGWVPSPVALPLEPGRPLLACGGHLRNTFALARGNQVWVGPHIGDLESLETLVSFEEGIGHLESLFEVEPETVVHDLHPAYLSTGYATRRTGRPRRTGGGHGPTAVGVQHHHAHLAGCLAEHGESGPAIGAIYDGTGYGTDGTVWGGELLVGDLAGFERVGHLWPVRLPGGEAAIRQPWRMACAWLAELGQGTPGIPAGLTDRVTPEEWETVLHLVRRGFASPLTTSMGRLFDAVSALCGLRLDITYEGQAAIELEMAARAGEAEAWPLPVAESEDGSLVLDARATIAAISGARREGIAAGVVSARFHEAVAAATADACTRLAGRHSLDTVVLSGGVFQNLRLLESTAARLAASGLRPLVPERFPPNDGGLSYGQAAAAAARASEAGR